MNASTLVTALSKVSLPLVFNPYGDRCPVHDRHDAPSIRRANLQAFLEAASTLDVRDFWVGRDLGYRGGRRTGLALTDEVHLDAMSRTFRGSQPRKATKGAALAERTAAEIWKVLQLLEHPPLLWNVFPLHPHEKDSAMTNRRFTARELGAVHDINRELIRWIKPSRIVAIGQDAASYGSQFGVLSIAVRHPSYGGLTEFRRDMRGLYGADFIRQGPPQLDAFAGYPCTDSVTS